MIGQLISSCVSDAERQVSERPPTMPPLQRPPQPPPLPAACCCCRSKRCCTSVRRGRTWPSATPTGATGAADRGRESDAATMTHAPPRRPCRARHLLSVGLLSCRRMSPAAGRPIYLRPDTTWCRNRRCASDIVAKTSRLNIAQHVSCCDKRSDGGHTVIILPISPVGAITRPHLLHAQCTIDFARLVYSIHQRTA